MLVLKTLVEMVFLVGAIILVAIYNEQITRFFRWLKGSRKTYFFLERNSAGKEIESSKATFRTQSERKYAVDPARDSVTEITRGLFRRRSAIYGNTANSWLIVRDWFDPIPDALRGDWVSLADARGLPVKEALEVVNRYPSFQAMLKQIAELEKGHLGDEAKIRELSAAIVALREQILSDRQRYRGVVALELRHDLETVINEVDIAVSVEDKSLKVWADRFRQHRIERDQSRIANTRLVF